MRDAPPALSAEEFRSLFDGLRRRVPWGPGDRRGALNYITGERVTAAARQVRTGRTIAMEAPIGSQRTADNPDPAVHRMTQPAAGDGLNPDGLDFAMDGVSLHVHGNADSHMDALCHVSYDGFLYNDVAADTVTADGAAELSIGAAAQGIAGRGVLLDIPRLRGTDWLEPGDYVTAADLAAAEDAQQVRVGPGDLLFVRVGHRRRRRELGPWDVASTRAGLHPAAAGFLADRQIAVLGSDSNNDTGPSCAEGVGFPVHVLAIRALGVHLLDYLQFDDLVAECAAAGRWSFFCVVAPLRLPGGTGSPVNPIAIF